MFPMKPALVSSTQQYFLMGAAGEDVRLLLRGSVLVHIIAVVQLKEGFLVAYS